MAVPTEVGYLLRGGSFQLEGLHGRRLRGQRDLPVLISACRDLHGNVHIALRAAMFSRKLAVQDSVGRMAANTANFLVTTDEPPGSIIYADRR